MANLPAELYTAEQIRRLDRYAIDQLGIPGYELMTRAAAASLRVLRSRWPNAKRIVVMCGSGNNAGDGYVLARLARQSGLQVVVIALFDPDLLRDDALTAYRDLIADGGGVVQWFAECVNNTDVIVDAIFGIGLSRPLDAVLSKCVQAMNDAPAPILSLDIPSGLHADSGQVLGIAVKATCTVTFIGLKLGFYLGVAPDHVGVLEFDDLEIPADESKVETTARRLTDEWFTAAVPKRSRLSHKGSNGHVLVVGGGIGMAGAVRLTGEACLRVGAGLVTVATRAESVASIVLERPELIVRAVSDAVEVAPLIGRADVIVIGPGLGQDAWAASLLDAVLASDIPIVVDADALNLLAKHPRKLDSWILTPHPGEAARLVGVSTAAVQANRFGTASDLAKRYGGVVVLKGANTLIAAGCETPAVCDQGNPAMATPGMGDVLAGVIAGLLAQFDAAWDAACVGVVAHAKAGDLAAADLGNVERGLIASDLFAKLPGCVSR